MSYHSLLPERVDIDRDTNEVRHIAVSYESYACGKPRPPVPHYVYGSLNDVGCVVCADLWRSTGGWDV